MFREGRKEGCWVQSVLTAAQRNSQIFTTTYESVAWNSLTDYILSVTYIQFELSVNECVAMINDQSLQANLIDTTLLVQRPGIGSGRQWLPGVDRIHKVSWHLCSTDKARAQALMVCFSRALCVESPSPVQGGREGGIRERERESGGKAYFRRERFKGTSALAWSVCHLIPELFFLFFFSSLREWHEAIASPFHNLHFFLFIRLYEPFRGALFKP